MGTEEDDDLRAAADSIASDAEDLAAIEEEKRGLHADDPRYLELSQRAKKIAEGLEPKTSAELELAVEAQR